MSQITWFQRFWNDEALYKKLYLSCLFVDNITLHIQTVGSWRQKIHDYCAKESKKCAASDASSNSLQSHQKDDSSHQHLTLTKNLYDLLLWWTYF